MNLRKHILARFRDESGAVIIEAALVLPVFLYLTFALIELAIIFFYSFVLESAMYDATRIAKVATNPASMSAAVRQQIAERSFGMIPPNEVVITTDLNVNFAENWQNSGEQCTDTAGVIQPDTYCPCSEGWLDKNNNGTCDGPPELQLGAPGNLVQVVAYYKKPIFTPFMDTFINQADGTTLIRSAAIFRNEP